jgi:hypothetical protein
MKLPEIKPCLDNQDKKSSALLSQIIKRIIAIEMNIGALEREKADLKMQKQNILQGRII